MARYKIRVEWKRSEWITYCCRGLCPHWLSWISCLWIRRPREIHRDLCSMEPGAGLFTLPAGATIRCSFLRDYLHAIRSFLFHIGWHAQYCSRRHDQIYHHDHWLHCHCRDRDERTSRWASSAEYSQRLDESFL